MALVFQYGSNTRCDRINAPNRLGGAARPVGLAHTCHPFQLEFSVWSRSNGCAAANLVQGRGIQIWGVLYEIPDARVFRGAKGRHGPGEQRGLDERHGLDERIRCLDQIEHEGTNYVRCTVDVVARGGGRDVLRPVTYLAKNPKPGIRTAGAYVAHLLHGLEENAAPRDYLDYVRARILHNNPTLTACQPRPSKRQRSDRPHISIESKHD